MFCSVITKNPNWEILTKNLVTFNEVKDEKLQYFWGSQKTPIYRGRGSSRKTNIEGEDCL